MKNVKMKWLAAVNAAIMVCLLQSAGFAEELDAGQTESPEIKERLTGFLLRGDVSGEVSGYQSDRNGFDDPNQLIKVRNSSGQIVEEAIGKYVDGLVVQVEWKHLQDSANGEIQHYSEGNVIDKAIAAVNAWNASNENQLGLKIRVFSGVYSPKWLTQHVHNGKLTLRNCENGSNATNDEVCGLKVYFKNDKIGILPSYWKPAFRTAWEDFQSKLAAEYNGISVVREIAVSGCMTHHAETMWRNKGDYNRPDGRHNIEVMMDVGLTVAKDKECLGWQIEVAAEKWPNTYIGMAYNMWNNYSIDDGQLVWTPGKKFTDELMQKCIDEAGTFCVLGNNSLGVSDIGDEESQGDVTYYLKSYGDVGHNIYVQTETAIDSQYDALNHAADELNATMAELPTIKAMNNFDETFLSGSQMQGARNNLKF
ncbi:hypothetical protein [Shewanella sp. GXUN23E]|uniref:hypothetical protein n=1 Tax=Shewanella sp. GXUN23E TaxID=3422498 RepID=UPI003D7DCF26